MSERPLLSRAAMALLAERRIRQAIDRGELENLPGTGKPIPGIDEPYDKLWWVKSWMRRADLARDLNLARTDPLLRRRLAAAAREDLIGLGPEPREG